MVHTHQDSREDGTTTHFSSQEAKNICYGTSDPQKLYSCTIESTLTDCITTWYCNCLASNHKALQRVMHTAQDITGAEFPAIQDLYTRRSQRKALKLSDYSNPSHRLLSLLPQSKRYRWTKSGTNRTLNSFYPQAIRLLNS